ncbi:hypothetical protein TWF694_011636 [Orbilia ellipsospora]|uniref:Alcohol acetyltransferase n=1 Tax=Orbilia ellipsospora TaxID=2528407 RepID=A0AAV9X710_9PEZI
MSTTSETSELPVLRDAGLIERFHIVRSSINFYNNVVVSASYSTAVPFTPDTLIRALHPVLKQHPILSVGVQLPSKPTSPPSFIRLPSIDFTKASNFILWEKSDTANSHEREYKNLICRLHDTPFKNDLLGTEPLWRIAVLQRSYHVPTAYDSPTNGEGRNDYEIVFCYHHAIADGMSGAAFHYSLFEALNSSADKATSGSGWHLYTPPEDLEILPPMEDVIDFGMGLKTAGRIAGHIAKGVLPSFLQKSVWTGGKVGDKLESTKIETVVVDPYRLESLIEILKERKVSMTSFITYATAEALYTTMKTTDEAEFGKMKTLRVSLPMSYRRHAEWGNDVMVDCIGAINWDIAKFKDLEHEVHAMRKLTGELKHESGVTRDTEVGLLALVPDMGAFFKGQVGKERGLTFEVSNLGVLDVSKIGKARKEDGKAEAKDEGAKKEADWRIEEALFSQSASIVGPMFSINVATVRGRMVIVVQWMDTVIKDKVMEALVTRLDRNLSVFGK